MDGRSSSRSGLWSTAKGRRERRTRIAPSHAFSGRGESVGQERLGGIACRRRRRRRRAPLPCHACIGGLVEQLFPRLVLWVADLQLRQTSRATHTASPSDSREVSPDLWSMSLLELTAHHHSRLTSFDDRKQDQPGRRGVVLPRDPFAGVPRLIDIDPVIDPIDKVVYGPTSAAASVSDFSPIAPSSPLPPPLSPLPWDTFCTPS